MSGYSNYQWASSVPAVPSSQHSKPQNASKYHWSSHLSQQMVVGHISSLPMAVSSPVSKNVHVASPVNSGVHAITTNQYGIGLGLIFDPASNRTLVRRISRGSSAKRCGRINVGDELISVNGQDVRSIPGHVLQNMLLGPLGSTIEISFRPHSSAQIQVITLQRGPSQEDSPQSSGGGRQGQSHLVNSGAMGKPMSAQDFADIWSHGDPYGGHFLPFKAPQGEEKWVEPGFDPLAPPPPTTNPSAAASGNVRAARAQQKAYSELARLARQEEESESAICGIGMDLGSDDDGNVFIARIYDGGVTAANGMLSEGDQICMIDHTNVQGLPASAIETMLLGDDNSIVIVSVLKSGEDRLTHATLIRQLINKEKSEKKYKEIYSIGLSFVVTLQQQVRITEMAPGGPAAKLGFIDIGDTIVALDEEPIPTDPDADIAAFVNARICGPKGSPVVLSLIKAGLGMKHHVQLRRTHLFGMTQLRSKNDSNIISRASTEMASMNLKEQGSWGDDFRGSVRDQTYSDFAPQGMELGANWSKETFQNPQIPLNPIQLWKEASWRPNLGAEVMDNLRQSVTNCLNIVASGGTTCYGMLIVPTPQDEPWIQSLSQDGPAMRAGIIRVGDIVAEIGGQSVRGLPFDRVTAILGASWMRGSSVDIALFRPSSNSNQLIHVQIPMSSQTQRPGMTLRV